MIWLFILMSLVIPLGIGLMLDADIGAAKLRVAGLERRLKRLEEDR